LAYSATPLNGLPEATAVVVPPVADVVDTFVEVADVEAREYHQHFFNEW
jgi:hypothetical protein